MITTPELNGEHNLPVGKLCVSAVKIMCLRDVLSPKLPGFPGIRGTSVSTLQPSIAL